MYIIFLFFLYSLLLTWCYHRLLRRKTVPLSLPETALAMGAKIAMGCLYGYIFLHYYHGDDTWQYHYDSLVEYDNLLHHTKLFFYELTPASAIESGNTFLERFQVYVMNLEYRTTVKLLGVFNIFSRGNYYINVVLFNAIVFWGHYWLFSLLVTLFPDKRKALFIVIFLFPAPLFWLSGIRADGLLLFFLSLALLQAYRWLHQHRNLSVIYVVIGVAGLWLFRTMLVGLVLPAIIAWAISVRTKRQPVYVFSIVYGIAMVLFLATSLLPKEVNLLNVIAKRQAEYFALPANTRVPLDTLQPSVAGYARVLPQAINNTFLQPYPWKAKGMLQVATSLDNLLLLAFIAALFFIKDPRWKQFLGHPVCIAMLFFSVSLYLLIGYMVPFPGAIARYKIIASLFLYCLAIIGSRSFVNGMDYKKQ
ncbi:MAG: hypothetical protein QM731_00605 [Chitinophagaceae bacterium]